MLFLNKLLLQVPPLRISLKTPSEDDPSEETAQPRGKTVGRGRPGKRQNDQDDAQRMTRSKVGILCKYTSHCAT